MQGRLFQLQIWQSELEVFLALQLKLQFVLQRSQTSEMKGDETLDV